MEMFNIAKAIGDDSRLQPQPLTFSATHAAADSFHFLRLAAS